jgi:hypothetical protein
MGYAEVWIHVWRCEKIVVDWYGKYSYSEYLGCLEALGKLERG